MPNSGRDLTRILEIQAPFSSIGTFTITSGVQSLRWSRASGLTG